MCSPRLRIAILIAVACVATPSGQRPATMTLSVVATTDLHGGVLQRGERGGLTLLGGYLRNLRAARAADGGGVLLVDSGDMFQGTLESNLNEGAAVISAYNALGYNAAAIGNHEFDFGPAGPDETPRTPGEDPRGALKARAAQARFPFLAANTIEERTGQPVTWPNVRPSTMVTVRGVKVGIVGVTTIDTAAQTIGANLGGLTFTALVPAITREAMSLRSRGATVVILLAHAGGRCTKLDDPEDTSSCDQMAEIVSAVRALPSGLIDMVSAGHTHQVMAQDFRGIPIVQAYSNGRSFSRVDVTINRSSGAVVGKKILPPQDLCARENPVTHMCDAAAAETAKLVLARYESRLVRPDAGAAAAIAPAVRRAMAMKNQPLGVFVEMPLARGSQQGETAIADVVSDGMLAVTSGADVAIGNGGSLRADLAMGPLTYGAMYELYPFDNRLVTITLTGDQLTRIIAFNLQRTTLPLELLPIAGFKVDARCEGRMLRVVLTRPSGAAIRPDEKLTMVTSDFVAGGGDGVLAPAGALGEARSPAGAPLLREAVIGWLKQRGGRLNEQQYVAPGTRRWQFPAPRPVMCS